MKITWIRSAYDIGSPDTDGNFYSHGREDCQADFEHLWDDLRGSDRWCAVYCTESTQETGQHRKPNAWAEKWRWGKIIALIRPAGRFDLPWREEDRVGAQRWKKAGLLEIHRTIAQLDAPDLKEIVDRVNPPGTWRAKHQAVTRGRPKRLDDATWIPVARELERLLASYL